MRRELKDALEKWGDGHCDWMREEMRFAEIAGHIAAAIACGNLCFFWHWASRGLWLLTAMSVVGTLLPAWAVGRLGRCGWLV